MRLWSAAPYAALLAFVAWRNGHAINLLNKPHLPHAYYAHADHADHCEVVIDPARELKYCEDAAFWDVLDSGGVLTERSLIISCDPGRKSWNTVMGPLRDPDPRGALWILTYDASGPAGAPRKLALEGYPARADFHPLGLDISPSTAGNTSNLFVVNHGRARSTVEQFALRPDDRTRARWVRTLTSRNFVAPNALALTSPASFYVTNDHLMTRRLPWPLGSTLPLLETLLGLPLGAVGHVALVDDRVPGAAVVRWTWPVLGVPFANGIALSPDGAHAAVASSSLAQVHIYARSADGALRLAHRVPLPFAPDNVAYADDGELLVAGHAHFPAVAAVAANTSASAPSWVVAVRPRPPGAPQLPAYDAAAPLPAARRARASPAYDVETLYQSDGTGFSTSSTGLRDTRSGALFVTGLYEEGLLACRP